MLTKFVQKVCFPFGNKNLKNTQYLSNNTNIINTFILNKLDLFVFSLFLTLKPRMNVKSLSESSAVFSTISSKSSFAFGNLSVFVQFPELL